MDIPGLVELVHDALIHPLLAGEQLVIQQRLLLNKTTLFFNKMKIIFFFFLIKVGNKNSLIYAKFSNCKIDATHTLQKQYTETESFDVSIEPKETKDKPKQFDREHILQFFTENLWFFRFFRFFSVFFSVFSGFSQFFRFVSKQFVSVFRLFRFYTETESFD